MAATLRAVLYSGFFSKREEFSSVEASSDLKVNFGFHGALQRADVTFVRLLKLGLRR